MIIEGLMSDGDVGLVFGTLVDSLTTFVLRTTQHSSIYLTHILIYSDN